jgi:hypothetical protein
MNAEVPQTPLEDADSVVSIKAQPIIAEQEPKRDLGPEYGWTSCQFLNLAMQQNQFSLVPEVAVRNPSDTIRTRLTCTISVSPTSFVPDKTFPIEDIRPGHQVTLRNLVLEPDFDKLLSLSEPVRGTISIAINSGEEVLFQNEQPLDIYTPKRREP